MTSPQNNMNPLTVVLPGIALFVTLGVLMLLLLGDTPTIEQEVSAAEVSVESQEVAEAEVTAEPEATEEPEEVVETDEPAETDSSTEEVAGDVGAYDPALITDGQLVYSTTCIACHGFDAQGVPGLGKTLLESEFMDGLTEAEFIEFINMGRDVTDPMNTTGVMMPPKGGNPTLTDEDIAAVWAYLRSLSDPMEGAAADTTDETASTDTEAAATEDESGDTVDALANIVGGSSSDDEDAEATAESTEEADTSEDTETEATDEVGAYDASLVGEGEVQYMTACVACHGFDLRGITGLGKDMIESEFIAGLTEAEFIEFVNTGRDITDPMNTTGVMMPPKGGNPALTDEDIAAIWAYIRSKTEAAGG